MTDKEIKTVAITGINGLIGRHIAEELLRRRYDVLGCSLESDCAVNGVSVYSQIDITDQTAVKNFFSQNKTDAVVHLAALVHQKNSSLSYGDYEYINTMGSRNIFDSAVESGIKAILFASTVEVYGNVDTQVVDEDTLCKPNSSYSISKYEAENLLETKRNLSYAVMRFAPVYAKEFTLNIDKRIYIKPRCLAYYFKSGKYTFNFCSIHNIVSFVGAWLENRQSGTYNISDEKSFSAKEVIDLEKSAGRAKIVIWLPYMLARLCIGVLELCRKLLGKEQQDSFFQQL